MMTQAKLEALRMLAIEPRFTWKCTGDGLIGGRVAACLEREGLVRNVAMPQWWAEKTLPKYEITEAGRIALELELVEARPKSKAKAL